MRRFASLPRDMARCMGTNCTKRNSCARYKQLDRDAGAFPDLPVSVTDAPQSGVCLIRIEELDDGR